MSEQKHTPEPFGYFKAEPFGWTDCAETDDCAVPLYDESAIVLLSAQRDELLAAAERQFEADFALINMPFNCTKQEHEAALEEHTNSHDALAKVIASVKPTAP